MEVKSDYLTLNTIALNQRKIVVLTFFKSQAAWCCVSSSSYFCSVGISKGFSGSIGLNDNSIL